MTAASIQAVGTIVVFFRDKNRKPYRFQLQLPVTTPSRIEIPHGAMPFAVESIERLLAYVFEDPKRCDVCRGKGCSACGYKPRRVGGYEQLFFPRRVRLDLFPWDAQPGRVTG